MFRSQSRRFDLATGVSGRHAHCVDGPLWPSSREVSPAPARFRARRPSSRSQSAGCWRLDRLAPRVWGARHHRRTKRRTPLLGTDQVGRDLLSRLINGGRISLFVGLAATTLNIVVAILVGGTSGFVGGRFDLAVQRFVDAWMAFPGLLLLLTIMSLTGPGLVQIIVVLGVSGGISGSRVPRGAVVAIKENDYFQAARAIGTPLRVTLFRHVLPNIMAPMLIVFSVGIGGNILSAASLGFLGYGLPPSTPDWGSMLSREGIQYMETAPWLALWPGLCLTIVVYCFNLFGDALRDLLDPRLRGAGRLGPSDA